MQGQCLQVWHVWPLMTLCRITSFQDETPMSISHAPMEGLNLNLHSVRCPSQIFFPQNDGWWWLVETASFLYLSRLSRLVKEIIRLVNETTKKPKLCWELWEDFKICSAEHLCCVVLPLKLTRWHENEILQVLFYSDHQLDPMNLIDW